MSTLWYIYPDGRVGAETASGFEDTPIYQEGSTLFLMVAISPTTGNLVVGSTVVFIIHSYGGSGVVS